MYRLLADRLARLLASVGSIGHFLSDTFRGLSEPSVWVGLTVAQMRRIGVNSIPISLLISSFTGIVLALQASYTLSGVVPLYFVGVLVGKSLMLELAPVLTGLALAGRVGANIAAEIGTMRVTEQVDALETLAFDKFSYLVVPRVIAASIMFPIVVALSIIVGIVAGWITSINLLDLSTIEFFKGLRQFYQLKDTWYPLVKSVSFGLIIASIGCMKGLSVAGGAEGVGRGTTEAVVAGSAMILILDAFWAVVLL